MRIRLTAVVGGVILACAAAGMAAPLASADTAPLYAGTVWLTPSIITEASPNAYEGVTDQGTGTRHTYDRRTGWVDQNAYLFRADFAGSHPIEMIVDPELGPADAARSQADTYARIIGRLPRACLTQVDAVWLHPGDLDAGGGNRSLLIHTGYGEKNRAFMEEVLAHECAHTSLDPNWDGAVPLAGWRTAVASDPGFISTYARDNPDREDVAESFLPYLALKIDPESDFAKSYGPAIRAQIGNRIAYFDSLNLDLSPAVGAAPATPAASEPAATGASTAGSANARPTGRPTARAGAACTRAQLGSVAKSASSGRLVCARTAAGPRWRRVRG